MATDGWKKSRPERIKQRWKWLAIKVPCRIHHRVLHFPRPRSNSQIKHFLVRRKRNKIPLLKMGQGKQSTGESQAADLRRITKSPR